MKTVKRKSLDPKEELALDKAVQTVKSRFAVEQIILFGSKAHGDHDAFSDLDLLLVTTEPLQCKAEKAIVEMLFDIGMTYDVIFSSLFVSKAEWNGGIFVQFPVYAEILRDGAVIE